MTKDQFSVQLTHALYFHLRFLINNFVVSTGMRRSTTTFSFNLWGPPIHLNIVVWHKFFFLSIIQYNVFIERKALLPLAVVAWSGFGVDGGEQKSVAFGVYTVLGTRERFLENLFSLSVHKCLHRSHYTRSIYRKMPNSLMNGLCG